MELPVIHNRSGYMAGCRCEVCTEANRLHAREHKRSRGKAAVLEKLNAEPRGRVVEAVATDLAACNAFEERPGLAATAMAMAELLDNASATPQWPAAAARLTAILLEVVPAVPVRASGLAAVREMTR